MKLQASTEGGRVFLGAALVTFLIGSVGSADATTFNVNQTIGLGSVVGTIQTDGDVGILTAADITAWNLQLNGVGATFNLTNGTSQIDLVGNDVTADAQHLFFNFSGADGGALLFQVSLFSGANYYCDNTTWFACFTGATVTPQTIFDPSAQHVPQAGNQIIGTAAAGGNQVPEPVTLSLFGAGLAGAVAMRRRKKKSV